jgi:hypothetical protein
MGIICVKIIIYEYKNHSDWRDYPRKRKDLSILKVKKRSLSPMP